MKILKENKVYVQKNDMAYINSTDLPIPASIYMRVFGRGITIIDDSNRYEFIEFTKPEEVEYFKSLDWIVDYNAVKDLTEEELIQLGQEIAAEKNRRANEFNAKPKSVRQQQYNAVMAELELLDYKMYTLRDIIMLNKGELDFPLPAGIEKRTVIDAESVEEISQPTPIQPSEGTFKKFIKSIFGKKNQSK